MKIAFSSLGCPGWSFEQILACAKENGYDAIEIRGIGDVMRTEDIPEFRMQNRADTRKRLADAGITICALDTSVAFDRGYDRAAVLEEGKKALEICNDMDIPFIRVFGNKIAPDEAEEAALDRAAEGVKALCAYAGSAKVLLESHGHYVRTAQFNRVMTAVDDARAGILWDVAHTVDEDFYAVCKRWIKHVHFKDRLNGALCAVGDGELPLDEIVRKLIGEGYDGALSLEWEKRWHAELDEPEIAFPQFMAWVRARGIRG